MSDYEVQRTNTEMGTGWQIRERTDAPGTGFTVTDSWLASFGFGIPSFLNIEGIIKAMWACYFGATQDKRAQGRAAERADPELTRTRVLT